MARKMTITITLRFTFAGFMVLLALITLIVGVFVV